ASYWGVQVTADLAVSLSDGTGTMTTPTTTVVSGSAGNTIVFTYTAAPGGVDNGTVTLAVPTGWTPPVTADAAGCTDASTGSVSTSDQVITVSDVTLDEGDTLTLS